MTRIVDQEELLSMSDTELGPSSWFPVEQERIQLFADATEDRQFIHTDPELARRTPFGTTIAHGFLTLSLLTRLSSEIALAPQGLRMAINYGLNKVRFLSPVLCDSEVRLRSRILDARRRDRDRILVRAEHTVETRPIGDEEHPPKTALVAETLVLFLVDPAGSPPADSGTANDDRVGKAAS